MASGSWDNVVQEIYRIAGLRESHHLPDRQLLESFVTHHNAAAFEVLVRRHGPMVLGVCRRILRHAQDAEDAFQATFLVLVRNGSSLRQRMRSGNWLYGVAYRTALQARRRSARRRRKEAEVPPMDAGGIRPRNRRSARNARAAGSGTQSAIGQLRHDRPVRSVGQDEETGSGGTEVVRRGRYRAASHGREMLKKRLVGQEPA